MKPGYVSQLLDIPDPTLRKWSIDYGQYLSVQARGGDGRKRNYDEQDIKIILWVRDLKAANTAEDAIHASLKMMQANGWHNLPELPPSPPGMDPIAVIPREAAEAQSKGLREAWAIERKQLTDKIEELEQRLKVSDENREVILKEMAEIRERLGVLSGRKSVEFWLMVIGGAILATVLIVVMLARLL